MQILKKTKYPIGSVEKEKEKEYNRDNRRGGKK